MRVIAKSTLKNFWEQSQYADSKGPLVTWYDEALQVSWATHRTSRGNAAMPVSAATIGLSSILAVKSTN